MRVEKLHRDHEALDSIRMFGSLSSRESALARKLAEAGLDRHWHAEHAVFGDVQRGDVDG